jgi:hypothetical protein
LFADLV